MSSDALTEIASAHELRTGTAPMNLNDAWQKYLADVEEDCQMFLTEPVIRERPETEAAAITLSASDDCDLLQPT